MRDCLPSITKATSFIHVIDNGICTLYFIYYLNDFSQFDNGVFRVNNKSRSINNLRNHTAIRNYICNGFQSKKFVKKYFIT